MICAWAKGGHFLFLLPTATTTKGRTDKREDVELVGMFYERPQITVDSHNRLWVVYRHFYNPQCGLKASTAHHIENGWRLDVRCLDETGWSPIRSFDGLQRDGMQRLSLVPVGDGFRAVWTTGRTAESWLSKVVLPPTTTRANRGI